MTRANLELSSFKLELLSIYAAMLTLVRVFASIVDFSPSHRELLKIILFILPILIIVAIFTSLLSNEISAIVHKP